MNEQRRERAQGLVELAIALPILLLLLMGVAEIGFLMRNYLIVLNADREACRYAAKGRYSDDEVIEMAVHAGGGTWEPGNPEPKYFLRTVDPDPNAAIIVTHIPMNSDGDIDIISVTNAYSGVVSTGGYSTTYVQPSNSTISLTLLTSRQSAATQSINDERAAAGYERMENHIIVVEIEFIHHPIFGNTLNRLSGGILPQDPWIIHTDTAMRVTMDRGGKRRRTSNR